MDEKKFCKKCGKQIDLDAEFCPHCGAKQSEITNPINKQVNNNSTSGPKRVNDNIGIIWLLIGWIFFVISFIPSLSWFQFLSFILGLVVQFNFKKYKNIGMALWIASLVLFGISFVFGFAQGFSRAF